MTIWGSFSPLNYSNAQYFGMTCSFSRNFARHSEIAVENPPRGNESWVGRSASLLPAEGKASSGGRGVGLIRGSACSGLLLAATGLTGLMNGIGHTSMCAHICAKTPVL